MKVLKQGFITNHFVPAIITLLLTVSWSTSSAGAKCKIMPLGDSITFDNTGDGTGYRQPLWLLLDAAHYRVDFVGSEVSGQGAIPTFDVNHAGFPGITDSELATLLQTGTDPRDNRVITPGPYLETFPADIVLLHIGTNGLNPDPQDVEQILEVIDQSDEGITVILARIINRRCSTDQPPCNQSKRTKKFNDNVEAMARERIVNGDRIIIVDMQDGAGINYQTDMVDNLHPNKTGYQKMASLWLEAGHYLLPSCSLPLHPVYKYKTDTERLTSDTSFQPDDHLFFDVGANERWTFEALLWIKTTDATGDFRFLWRGPTGSDVRSNVIAYQGNNIANQAPHLRMDTVWSVDYSQAVSIQPIYIKGQFSTRDSGGRIRLEWGQRVASGTTSLYFPSYLEARRVK